VPERFEEFGFEAPQWVIQPLFLNILDLRGARVAMRSSTFPSIVGRFFARREKMIDKG